jgi:putative ABC transport system permease protein
VEKFDTTVVHVDGLDSVELIAVDRATFARGAYWDGSFSDASLEELLHGLAPGATGSPAPVLIAGGTLPPTGEIHLEAPIPVTVPFRSVETASAFPGKTAHVPLIVIDRRLVPPDAPHLNQLWVRGEPSAIEPVVFAAIAARPDPPLVLAESVADNVEATNDFLPLFWMLRFLEWLGLATGLIAVWGVLLHLEAQQRTRQVSYSIARRMGLTASENRASLLLELGATLAAATAVGTAIAWIAARLVAGTLDLKPELPPAALFRVPWPSLGVVVVVIAIVCWIAVRLVQRGTARTDVGRVMRSAA